MTERVDLSLDDPVASARAFFDDVCRRMGRPPWDWSQFDILPRGGELANGDQVVVFTTGTTVAATAETGWQLVRTEPLVVRLRRDEAEGWRVVSFGESYGDGGAAEPSGGPGGARP